MSPEGEIPQYLQRGRSNLFCSNFHADARLSEAYRGLLRQILDCFVSKLGTLRAQSPRIVRCGYVIGLCKELGPW